MSLKAYEESGYVLNNTEHMPEDDTAQAGEDTKALPTTDGPVGIV